MVRISRKVFCGRAYSSLSTFSLARFSLQFTSTDITVTSGAYYSGLEGYPAVLSVNRIHKSDAQVGHSKAGHAAEEEGWNRESIMHDVKLNTLATHNEVTGMHR